MYFNYITIFERIYKTETYIDELILLKCLGEYLQGSDINPISDDSQGVWAERDDSGYQCIPQSLQSEILICLV